MKHKETKKFWCRRCARSLNYYRGNDSSSFWFEKKKAKTFCKYCSRILTEIPLKLNRKVKVKLCKSCRAILYKHQRKTASGLCRRCSLIRLNKSRRSLNK